MTSSDTRKQFPATESITKLTEAVVEILNNPCTPDELYDAVSNAVLCLGDQVPAAWANPDILRVQFPIAVRYAIRRGQVSPTPKPEPIEGK